MNTEQLNLARLARWSQNGDARLTLEAAAEWLGDLGFCPWLPTAAAPAPSFVEAVVGRPAHVPSAAERDRARALLARMIEASGAIPLKFESAPGEEPDFIASPEAFRYIYALRGNRNLKADPATVGNEKVSPLALHCWQAIHQQGPLSLPALQSILGRDMTEPAILRALQELWSALYVCPILSADGVPPQWEMLSRRFPEAVSAGAATGQAEALSAVVSLYVYAAVAATEGEILAFLSPLAAQSKLREVIRGLGSMRQLEMLDMAGRAHLALQGGLLPESVAQVPEEELSSTESGVAPEIEIERAPEYSGREGASEAGKFVPKKFVPKKFAPRKFTSGDSSQRRPAPQRFDLQASEKPRGRKDESPSNRFGPGERARRWEKSGEERGSRPPERRVAGKPGGRFAAGSPPGAKPWASKGRPAGDGAAKPWAARKRFGAPEGEGARQERPQRPASFAGGKAAGGKFSGGKSAGFKPAGGKPWSRKTEAGAAGERPQRPARPGFAAGARPAGDKPYKGKRSTFQGGGKSPGGGKPWVSRAGAPRPAAAERERPRRWEKSGPAADPEDRRASAAKPFGFRKGGAKPWAAKGAESRVGAKSYPPGKSRKPAAGKPWTARASAARDEAPKREQPERRADQERGGKPGAKPFWAKSPRGGKGSPAPRGKRPRGGKQK